MLPEDQKAWGKVGAHESWARTKNRTARTAPARQAFERRFDDEVDPDRMLDPEERAVRAAHARKAYFQRLALKSAEARRDNAREQAS